MKALPACFPAALMGLLLATFSSASVKSNGTPTVEVWDARTGGPALIPHPSRWNEKLASLQPNADTAAGREQIVDALLEHYRTEGYPVMEVEAEAPSSSDAPWRLRVHTGVISSMSLTGGSAWMQKAVARDWARSINQPLNLQSIEEWLDWTHRNPFHQATLGFTPGQAPASAEGLLTLHSTKLLNGYLQWRNDGVSPLGQHRFAAGLETGDLWGWPVYVAAEVLADESFSDMLGARATMRWFLPSKHELRLSGGWARVDVDGLLPGYDLSSSLRTWDFSARYLWPINSLRRARGKAWKVEAGMGVDYRRTRSGVSLAGLSLEGTADTFHLAAELNAQHRSSFSQSVMALQGFFSPGGVTGRDTDAARSVLRTGAEGDYWAARADLWTRIDLSQGWALDARATAQWSEAPLLATEQLSLAGASGVRGYEEAATLADSGAWARLELQAPAWRYPVNGLELAARPLAFFDAGWGCDKSHEDTATLVSGGLGVRAQLTTHASLTFDYGWRFTEPGGRAHVALRLNF